jgi:excisionase family DNA binding protein
MSSEIPSGKPRQLLTVREVASRLSVSVRTVWRLIEQGKLRTRRIGNATRVEAEHLDDFIDDS